MLHADLSKSTLDLASMEPSKRRLSSQLELDVFNGDQDPELNRKNLIEFGGLRAIELKLNTSFKSGIKTDAESVESRKDQYGINFVPEPDPKTWIGLFIGSFEDTTLIVLIISAVVSLIVGTYDDPDKGWIEGAAILFAVVLVACVTATNDYNKDAQFRKLNAVKDDLTITVIRDGNITTISIKDLLVGDIVQLSTGNRFWFQKSE
jgi:magnesium-transporting ATPase (P-type)